jgi:hypothetical protein
MSLMWKKPSQWSVPIGIIAIRRSVIFSCIVPLTMQRLVSPIGSYRSVPLSTATCARLTGIAWERRHLSNCFG